jgi:hypothetical protein
VLQKFRSSPSLFIAALVLGFFIRLGVARLGSNYDMESWVLTARVMDGSWEIYSAAGRYNYGPVWAYILHLLAHLTPLLTGRPFGIAAFHLVVAGFLSLVDVAIASILRASYGMAPALVFYLCPVTVLLTGYHSHFDNLAVLLGLGAWIILRSPPRRGSNRLFAWAAVLVGASLATKHILVFFPLWILLWPACGTMWRRAAFGALALGIFGLSFLPWALQPESRHWIMVNVVGYNSISEFALLPRVLDLFPPLPGMARLLQLAPGLSPIRLIWMGGVLWVGWTAIRREREGRPVELYPLYLAAIVALSPAAANQYLAVPMVAIAIYHRNPFSWLYIVVGSIFVFCSAPNLGGLPPYHHWNIMMVEAGMRYYHVLVCLLLFLVAALRGIDSWGAFRWPSRKARPAS